MLYKTSRCTSRNYYFSDKFTFDERKETLISMKRILFMSHLLSPSIYSIIACEIDNLDKAYELYSRTARLDLDNYNNDTEDGLHITSMSGAWLSIVQVFAGMKTNNQTLSFSPKLPDKWNSYSFNINYRENKLKVEVNKDGVNITNLEGNDIEINVYDKKYIVKNKEYIDNKDVALN